MGWQEAETTYMVGSRSSWGELRASLKRRQPAEAERAPRDGGVVLGLEMGVGSIVVDFWAALATGFN